MVTVQINVTMDGNADLTRFTKSLRTNILWSQTKIIRRLGKIGQERVKMNAPVWKGTLKNKVALKVFPRAKRAEILMAGTRANEVALQNEFNIKGMRKLYKTAYPKLAEWADDKGVFQGKPFVIVGGRNTRLGRQNVFFLPAFQQLLSVVPKESAIAVAEAIRRTRS